MPKAKAAAARALEIDDTLAEAWASLAAVKWWYEWDWDGAAAAYERAIKRNPSYATAHDGYAMLLCARGRFEASLAQVRKASELDPLSRIIAVHAGWPFYFARDYESAIGRFEKALELDDKFIPAQAWRGMALGQLHRYEEALASFQRALETDRVPILLAMLGHTRAIAGHRAEAEMILSMLAEQAKTRYISPYDVAIIYAGLGEKTAALAKLNEAYEDRSAWLVFVNVDPRLDGLREEGEFRELAARLK
jgi:tetratricopeptide (TPR) repeat protein